MRLGEWEFQLLFSPAHLLIFSWQLQLFFIFDDRYTDSLHWEQWALLWAAVYQHLPPLGMLAHILVSHWAKNTQVATKILHTMTFSSSSSILEHAHTHTPTLACAIAVAEIVVDIHMDNGSSLVNYVKVVMLTHNFLPHVTNIHYLENPPQVVMPHCCNTDFGTSSHRHEQNNWDAAVWVREFIAF